MTEQETLTVSKLSTLTGYDRRTISGMLNGKTKVTLGEFCAALRNHYEADVQSAREKRATVQAQLLELTLRERTHELVSADVVTRMVQGLIISARTKLCHLPSKLVNYDRILDLDAIKAERLLDTEIRSALEELSAEDGHEWWEDGAQKPDWIAPFHAWIKNFPPPPETIHPDIYGDEKQTTESRDAAIPGIDNPDMESPTTAKDSPG